MAVRKKNAEKKHILFSDEFYSDICYEDMLYAELIRSPFSYGKIKSISFSKKTKIPQGYTLLTYKDIPGKNIINILGTNVPLLSEGEIAYKGEVIALITGENREILRELKKSIQIELEKSDLKENESKFSKSYNNLSVSLKDGNPIEQSILSLRYSLPNFLEPFEIIAKRKFQTGDPGKIFSDSENSNFIIENTWKNQQNIHSNCETEGCICHFKGENLNIITPTQWISGLQKIITEATGVPKNKIFITKTKTGTQTTNSLFINGIFCALCTIAAKKTGKPVRLNLTRCEHEELFESAPEVKIYHKTAVDKNGLIQAMDISLEFNAGSYNPFAKEILDRLSISAVGAYNCKNVRVTAKAFKSHNCPSSFNLEMIDSYAFFAIENQIQKISEEINFSPLELRILNKAGGMQKSTLPFTYSFGRANDVLNAVAIRSDFKRKYAVARLSEHNRFESEENMPYSPSMRGIAVSCAFDGSGYLGLNFEKSTIFMQVSVTEEKKLIIHAYPERNSIKEIWTKLITENLDIDKKSIIFTNELSDETEKKSQNELTIPNQFIGTISIKTILLKKCIDAIKRKKINGTAFSVKKSLQTAQKKLWNQEEFTGSPYYNTAFGACTVELELNKYTYRESIRKICVIIDGGRILNPKAAEISVYRSIQRCLKMLVKDEKLDCPAISVQFTQSEEEPKHIGNLIYSMLPAAYSSALSQALSAKVHSLPLDIDSIYKITEARN